jgi:hypothetical protein
MVRGTAVEQFRIRVRRALERGESYPARGANKAILEEIRNEVESARTADPVRPTRKAKRPRSGGVGALAEESEPAPDQVALDHAPDQVALDHAPDQVALDHAPDQVALDHAPDQVALDHAPDQVALDQARHVRLGQLVWRLETLAGRDDDLSNYAREKLTSEQLALLTHWPQGPWLLPDLKRQARRQLKEQEPEATGPAEGRLALRYSMDDSQAQVLEIYRAEFQEERDCARQAIVKLQLAALEVADQRRAARKEREGLHYHEGYNKAMKDFRAAFARARFQTLVGQGWLLDCCAKAGLNEDYSERGGGWSSSSLVWPPCGC